MRRFLDYESGVFQFLGKITECICLSLLWVFLSAPIITMGAATTALYYSVNKTIRKSEGYMFRSFWDSFKMNFKQATGAWLLFLVILCVLGADFYIFVQSEQYNSFSVIFLILIAMVIVCYIYLSAHMARFTDKMKKAIRNCVLMFFLNIHWSVLLFVLLLGAVLIHIFIPFALFFIPALYMLVTSYILERIFKKYSSEE